MTEVIDAKKSPDLSILVLNEKSWEEFYSVSLPHDIPARKRKQAESLLAEAGYKPEYRFDQKVVDKRSLSLAKAQAASMVKRIANKTGLKMVVSHGIHVTG